MRWIQGLTSSEADVQWGVTVHDYLVVNSSGAHWATFLLQFVQCCGSRDSANKNGHKIICPSGIFHIHNQALMVHDKMLGHGFYEIKDRRELIHVICGSYIYCKVAGKTELRTVNHWSSWKFVVGLLWVSGHNNVFNHWIHILASCVFLFRDISFNVYYWF